MKKFGYQLVVVVWSLNLGSLNSIASEMRQLPSGSRVSVPQSWVLHEAPQLVLVAPELDLKIFAVELPL